MDMKKILQAMDGAKTKAEVNSSDMKRFLRAVTEADVNQPAATPMPGQNMPPTQINLDHIDAKTLDSAEGFKAAMKLAASEAGVEPETAQTVDKIVVAAPDGTVDIQKTFVTIAAQFSDQLGELVKMIQDLALSYKKGMDSPEFQQFDDETKQSVKAAFAELTAMIPKIVADAKKMSADAKGMQPQPAVQESTGMSRFLSIVTEAELNQPEAAPATSTLEQDPNFIKYTQLMSKYDMLSAEMRPDSSGLGVEKGWSPEFEKEVNSLKAQADQLAGPNAQAWAQARKITPQQTQQQLATQLEETGMSRLLSIVTEGRGPLNRSTAAEAMTMQHYTAPKKTITNPVLNVQEGAKPSMIGKYFKAVETELAEAEVRSKDRARQLAERVIERVTPNADGSLPDPSINRLTGKPNAPASEPAPSNVKPGSATVDYGGTTYSVNVFGDGIRPRIGRSDKVIPAKAYVVGDKMYVLLDTATQESVAGPKNCWPGYRKTGTQPGTGKNAGKRVNDCEKIKKEAVNPAQQAAIAIAKKKAGKK